MPGEAAENQRYRTRPQHLRSRVVNLHPDWLARPGEKIVAEVFDDVELSLIVEETWQEAGALLTKGHLENHPDTLVLFASYGDKVSAVTFDSQGRSYRILPSPEGNHVIAEVDPALPICDGVFDEETDTSISSTTEAESTDSSESALVDIMVLYTLQATAEFGGHDGLRSLISLHIGFTNSAFVAGEIPVKLRLVHRSEANYDEDSGSGTQDDLDWLENDSDVASLRDQYGADLVSMVITRSSGRAQLLGPHSVVPDNPDTFAHEIGHNFHAEHEKEEAKCATCNPSYNYGYYVKINTLTYGSMMSYTGQDFRVPYYSNPDTYWKNEPFGDADTADNARRITETRSTVEGWRTVQVAYLESPRFGSSSEFEFDLTGPSSQQGSYTIEYTEDYLSWSTLGTVQFDGTTLTITDTSVGSSTPHRFYRALKDGSLIIPGQLGFVRQAAPEGDSMVGNQLDSGDHRIESLWPSPPDGITLYKWDSGRQQYDINGYAFGQWDDPNMFLAPGEGVILRNESGSSLTLEFTGHVWSGFNVHLPQDWSIVASAVPQGGLVSDELAFPYGNSGDEIHRMTGTDGSYTEFTSDGSSSWSPYEPDMDVGEAFWIDKLGWQSGHEDYNWSRVLWTWP